MLCKTSLACWDVEHNSWQHLCSGCSLAHSLDIAWQMFMPIWRVLVLSAFLVGFKYTNIPWCGESECIPMVFVFWSSTFALSWHICANFLSGECLEGYIHWLQLQDSDAVENTRCEYNIQQCIHAMFSYTLCVVSTLCSTAAHVFTLNNAIQRHI